MSWSDIKPSIEIDKPQVVYGSSLVECFTRDRGAAGSSLTGLTALCPLARHINHCLVLVQPRKTGPIKTERLLMGGKETNKKKYIYFWLENVRVLPYV